MNVQIAGGIAALVIGILLVLLLLPGIPKTISDITKRKVSTSHWKRITKNSVFGFGILLMAVGLYTTFQPSLENIYKEGHSPDRLLIQADYYHIGDVECLWGIQDGQIVKGQCFSHPAPQENPFNREFYLEQVPTNAVLHLTARSIDPDEKKSPIKIFINGGHADYLNRYFVVETMEEKSVIIPLNVALLRIGENTLQIFVEPTTLSGMPNTDDIEFWNVYIDIEY